MGVMGFRACGIVSLLVTLAGAALCPAQQAGSSSSKQHAAPQTKGPPSIAGGVSDNVYRNPYFGFSCKIPLGWVLRTEEMNAPREDSKAVQGTGSGEGHRAELTESQQESEPQRAQSSAEDSGPPAYATAAAKQGAEGRVLLAAFSRPPEAAGAEVNSSIVIAAEPVEAYPGLKHAAQYFGPLTEVTAAQGFKVDNEPYEFGIGGKQLVRGDFSKVLADAGEPPANEANPAVSPAKSGNVAKTMHQATLVILARGYAVSFTFIAGSEEDVDGLLENLNFQPTRGHEGTVRK